MNESLKQAQRKENDEWIDVLEGKAGRERKADKCY